MKKPDRIFYLKFLIAVLFLGSVLNANGQTNCSQVLVDAQNLFEDGKINEIPMFIESCMVTGFTKDEKIEAYKLLSMVYTFLDEDENADQSVLNLLKLDKEYTINPELDPAEFIEVFNTFRTHPILRVGLKAGTNTNIFRVFETYEVHNGADAGTYTTLNGMQFGLAVEVPIKDKFDIVPEAYYMTRSYNFEGQYIFSGDDVIRTTRFTEQQVWLLAPVHFRYKYLEWQIIPYGDIGFTFGYLLSSELSSIETSPGDIETPTLDWYESREKLNYFVSAGLGAKYKIPMGYLFVEARYGFQVNRMSVLNTEPTPQENILLWNNMTRNNAFSMDFISIQVGYMFNIYSPKKLEQ
ncbi:outer membrane beta-barrel protein [Bacteroidota bacterium]